MAAARVVQKMCLLKEASVQVASISSLRDDTSHNISRNSDSATQYDIPFHGESRSNRGSELLKIRESACSHSGELL